ncbi:SPOR domain-containing protein [Halomonas aquamarina]|uniref:SPOR domain-containing protein n=1 Tax=Vreelandella aquamarina TaxID=77097 RepID=A0ACC5VWD0_9GAMM|nr:SPOR domain-containing protein [Halomonas aquamarina]MBZ5488275.1 SPOR domain-containing protein [Halomonas aquamarina]
MKYGRTERISGIVILLALLAIFVPWLMSDPAPREERPQPTFIIEQPIDTARRDVAIPEMPSTIGTPSSNGVSTNEAVNTPIDASPSLPQTNQIDPPSDTTPSQEPNAPPSNTPTRDDPIAELVASSDNAQGSSQGSASSSNASGPSSTKQGEWAVQVGSFGDAANAERLGNQLTDEGFSIFTRQRDNNLTTVLVGPYASSEDGEAAMALIKQRANVQGLLVRVRD